MLSLEETWFVKSIEMTMIKPPLSLIINVDLFVGHFYHWSIPNSEFIWAICS